MLNQLLRRKYANARVRFNSVLSMTALALVVVGGMAGAPARAADPSLDQMFVNAQKALNSGNSKEAVKILTRAAEIAPNDPEIYLVRARAYTADSDHTKALADAGKAIELKPDDPEMYLARARVYRANDKYELALADVEKAVTLAPNNPDVYLSRADIHLDMGNDALAKADEAKAAALEKAAR